MISPPLATYEIFLFMIGFEHHLIDMYLDVTFYMYPVIGICQALLDLWAYNFNEIWKIFIIISSNVFFFPSAFQRLQLHIY